jgi:hypothetical protein
MLSSETWEEIYVQKGINKIYKQFIVKEYSVFLDVAQAFDRVWHKGLLHKLR